MFIRLILITLFTAMISACGGVDTPTPDNSSGSSTTGGVSTGNFGLLTLQGNDTAVIGNSFQTVNAATSTSQNITAVAWSAGLGQTMTISTINGQPSSVILVMISPVTTQQVYTYALDCFTTPSDCSNLSVNLASKTAVFNGLSMPVGASSSSSTNVATQPIVVTGTLSWQD